MLGGSTTLWRSAYVQRAPPRMLRTRSRGGIIRFVGCRPPSRSSAMTSPFHNNAVSPTGYRSQGVSIPIAALPAMPTAPCPVNSQTDPRPQSAGDCRHVVSHHKRRHTQRIVPNLAPRDQDRPISAGQPENDQATWRRFWKGSASGNQGAIVNSADNALRQLRPTEAAQVASVGVRPSSIGRSVEPLPARVACCRNETHARRRGAFPSVATIRRRVCAGAKTGWAKVLRCRA